jgi:hypothetical protein
VVFARAPTHMHTQTQGVHKENCLYATGCAARSLPSLDSTWTPPALKPCQTPKQAHFPPSNSPLSCPLPRTDAQALHLQETLFVQFTLPAVPMFFPSQICLF